MTKFFNVWIYVYLKLPSIDEISNKFTERRKNLKAIVIISSTILILFNRDYIMVSDKKLNQPNRKFFVIPIPTWIKLNTYNTSASEELFEFQTYFETKNVWNIVDIIGR